MSLLSDYIEYASSSQTVLSIGDVVYVLNKSGTSSELAGFVKNNGIYSQTTHSALYGQMGLIRLYTDLLTWTTRTSGTATALYDAAYGNGLYVAVGDAGVVLSSTNAVTWTSVTSFTATSIEAITYGNGYFYCVGLNGVDFSSTDAVTWTAGNGITASTASDGTAVTYGNGLYVITLLNGQLRTSTDLSTWTTITRSSASGIYSIAYGGGKYIGAGINGIIVSSTNGTTWVEQTLGTLDFTQTPNQISYDNGLFVLLGNNGDTYTCLTGSITSGGAVLTLAGTFGGVTHTAIDYKDGLYVGATSTGLLRISTNGTTWETKTSFTSSAVNKIASYSANNTYIALTPGGGIFTSPYNVGYYDFNTQFFVPPLTSTQDILNDSPTTNYSQDVTYDAYVKATSTVNVPLGTVVKTLFYHPDYEANAPLTVNDGTAVRAGEVHSRASYPDLVNQIGLYNAAVLTPRTSGTLTPLNAATYGNGVYVYAGDSGIIASSTNAITWDARTSGSATDLRASTYGNGTYIICGNLGTIFTSTDGTTWTIRTASTSSNFVGSTYGNSTYLLSGANGLLRTSTDGVTWTARSGVSGGADLWAVSYGNGLYIYGGNAGLLASSTNAITWDARTSGTGNIIYAVNYGNGIHLFGAEAGVLGTSTDGTTWTLRTSGTTNTIRTVGYGNGLYYYMDHNGAVGTSTDATTWTSRAAGTSTSQRNFVGTAYGNGVYVLVDVLANVYTSTEVSVLQYSPNYDAINNFYVPLVKNYTVETLTTNAVVLQEIPYVRAS